MPSELKRVATTVASQSPGLARWQRRNTSADQEALQPIDRELTDIELGNPIARHGVCIGGRATRCLEEAPGNHHGSLRERLGEGLVLLGSVFEGLRKRGHRPSDK